jgi:hypothetical protein
LKIPMISITNKNYGNKKGIKAEGRKDKQ